MKIFFRKTVLYFLKKFAKRRLKNFKGKIIGVTGSVGKTSTKDAIYTVLNTKFKVLRNKGNMNTEFGLPLTILELDSGFGSATKWFFLLIKAYFRSIKKMYSEVVILEMGVDKPGDMSELLSIVKPDVGVMGIVAPVHLEEGQFESLDDIFEEKSKLIKSLGDDCVAILSADDDRTLGLTKGRSKKLTHTYGFGADADFKATSVEESVDGVTFNFNMEGRRVEAHLPVLGKHHVGVALPAIICGLSMGMSLEETLEALKRYQLPPGRLNLIEGKKEGSIIIDGSYNSSPTSCVEALKTLSELKPKSGGKRIAILGNMNELGADAEKLHKSVGEHVKDSCDILAAVGKMAELFADGAEENGLKKVFRYKNVQDLIDNFTDKIGENDIVLVKGSQNNVRLERFVKEAMKFPEQAKDLLVRQGRNWGKI
ncbi:UDP-N-acetylmuramoyl-tripeptide--D-alanyl-D-alanine ligase [Candidatus Peregrinibacteria bacterium]|jgi:UDP-N-acetylmuramoyl-tripeptide--D-alanyl-D-alanine ligase|nr:UDP-N-acetylmuramoyl-tripeptide--D-alanyl-D-alanine ligase [Candidatus Peregrinibacteria bacterium]MBT4148041.1 UDP-N-acetylmuramoyl-tripeptide--D-alanyl-D-alanine ligase [Candidatus Peregrinibacteria bacterium]MBT4366055.1 UDP-N-acetylmuramoyl-tripeptide--D-alanyl-D-alanine ligase [Candidatus Peregrinibacteria bacterium]MBT4455558.1 UDP-N-acetylmuramoyl-tripeptide--D-alanyl-D-alanine ligase [Candidatus Peregrinibacteria bacterium]